MREDTRFTMNHHSTLRAAAAAAEYIYRVGQKTAPQTHDHNSVNS